MQSGIIEKAASEIIERVRAEFAPDGPQGLPSIPEILTRHFGQYVDAGIVARKALGGEEK